jgi:hypothetical protein
MVTREDKGLVARAFVGLSPNSAGNIRTNCPLCEMRAGKVDRKRSMSMRVKTGWYRCFRCGAVGRLDDVAGSYDFEETEEDVVKLVEPPEAFYELAREPGRSSLACKPFRDYLVGRGVKIIVARDVGIGGCVAGRMNDRVVVPVRSEEGFWLWWVARSIHKSADRKYMYPCGSRKGVLFNHAALFVETDVPALVVEGCFDALPYWPDAVALLGKPTEEHMLALLAARRPICVALDGDAWLEGAGLTLRLRMEGQRAGALRLPPKKDPDEMCVDEIRHLAMRSIDA